MLPDVVQDLGPAEDAAGVDEVAEEAELSPGEVNPPASAPDLVTLLVKLSKVRQRQDAATARSVGVMAAEDDAGAGHQLLEAEGVR